ncbi:hypothetical protein ACJZ2D_002178 [Fusarium nematophilum]
MKFIHTALLAIAATAVNACDSALCADAVPLRNIPCEDCMTGPCMLYDCPNSIFSYICGPDKTKSNTPSLYPPLNTGNHEIRLLEIISQDPVTCTLHIVSLDSEPRFVAPSYVWGEPAATQEISINGIPKLDGNRPGDRAGGQRSLDLHLRLGDLSFWSRIWIQQEVVLTRRLHYISPSGHLSHGKFILAVQCLHASLVNHKDKFLQDVGELKMHRAAVALSKLATVLFLRQLVHNPTSKFKAAQYLWAMKLAFSADLEATRPLDYVYGLLGLSGLDIIPDYSRTTREVYIEFTQKHLETWHRLDLAAGRARRDSGVSHRECLRFLRTCAAGIQRDQGLPTWAPAMSTEKEMRAMCPGRAADDRTYDSVGALLDCPDIRVVGDGLLVSVVRAQTVRSCYREAFSQDFLSKGLGSCLEWFLEEYGPKGLYGLLLNHGQLTEELLERMKADGLTLSPGSASWNSVLAEWMVAVDWHAGSMLINSEDGYIGLAGAEAQEGDVVCILASCNSPVVLRPEGDNYLFVGCCFVLGLLHGEVAALVDSGRGTVEVIKIW